MPTANQVRDLLQRHGTTRPQSVSEWNGEIPLPPAVERFYIDVGPNDIYIEGQGNPYFLPKLADLWQFQAGYRWHAFTGERLTEWDDDWLVVADEGGDPFIFSRAAGSILFAHHGAGIWKPDLIFPDIFTMAACMAILGSVVSDADKDFCDCECRIRPKWQAEARQRIAEIMNSMDEVTKVLDLCGWIDPDARTSDGY